MVKAFTPSANQGSSITPSIRYGQMKRHSAYTFSPMTGEKAKYLTAETFGSDGGMIRSMLILRYLQASWRCGAAPWNFFQLNSEYFNKDKGIFSKLDLDSLIPEQWRLQQNPYDPERIPVDYPVFVKPEWGQNALGIARLGNDKEFLDFAPRARRATVPYIVQQAAGGSREFEVYYLRSPDRPNESEAFFITEVINRQRTLHPINSVHNPDTSYLDITSTFGKGQLQSLWSLVGGIGRFKMARLCLKANSPGDLLAGKFQVVEMNLFLPMPLVLLAENVDPADKAALVHQLMDTVARLVGTLPKRKKKSIFFRKLLAHLRIGR